MAAKGKAKSNPKSPGAPGSRQVETSPDPASWMLRAHFWQQHWLPAALLMGLAFALYAIGIRFGYVLDDEIFLSKNEYVLKGFSGFKQILSTDSFLGYYKDPKVLTLLEGGRYRPLSMLSFATEIGIFGTDHPAISHVINVLLYGATGILLYRIFIGLLPGESSKQWYFSLGFLAATFFMLHPVHVECVANIKGRDEILALLSSLAALWATLKYLDTNSMRFRWLAGFFMFLALLSKENALTFVAIIPLTVAVFANVSTSRNLRATLPLLLAAGAFILLRYQVLGFMLSSGKAAADMVNNPFNLMNNPFLGMTLPDRLATIFLTLGWYIKLLFVPYPLTIDYYPYQVPKATWANPYAIAALLLHIGMGVWAIRNLKKAKIPAYAILLYLLTLSIVSNLFVSVGTFMNERFLYMPSVGFCLLVAWFFARWLPVRLRQSPDTFYPVGGLAAGLLAIAFTWITVQRVGEWRDNFALKESAVRASPNSARAQCLYARSVYENLFRKAETPAEKARWLDTVNVHINRAIEIYPLYNSAIVMQAMIAVDYFALDQQAAPLLDQFKSVLRKTPYDNNVRGFLDNFMKHPDGLGTDDYLNFCHWAAYEFFFKEKKDTQAALYFLQFGIAKQANSVRLLQDAAEVYTAMGDTANANQLQARAAAAASGQ